MNRQAGVCLLLIGTVWLTAGAGVAAAQDDTLARVKTFYASAAYEEALQLIDRSTDGPASTAAEAAAYRVFCLVALGRLDQAKRAIEATVRLDPTYHPSDSLVSPRVRTLYEETRRPLLPQLARQTYAKAKAAFDRKDVAAAAPDFDRALALLDELAEADDPSITDLRTLVAGFRELCKPQATPASEPAVAPSNSKKPDPAPSVPPQQTPNAPDAPAAITTPPLTAASPMPDRAIVYGPEFSDVRPPVAVNRTMPAWSPSNSFEAKGLTGILEVIVNEDGAVVSATMRKSVQAAYDANLVRAASNWKFRPATKNGVAVMYRLEVRVDLGRE